MTRDVADSREAPVRSRPTETVRRLAVVSPFIDRRHGTERRVAELIERLILVHGWQVHVYSQRVEDLRATVVWHRIPEVRGPYLVRYSWWFLVNHLWRWWDRWIRRLKSDLTYSPGINCFDAHVISVHIVFAKFYEAVRDELRLLKNPLGTWPRLVHRHLYYRLIIALERLIYRRRSVRLEAISQKTARDLARLHGRDGDDVSVLYHGIDSAQFSPEVRRRLRLSARTALGLPADVLTLLLVGNDWKNKGLACLLAAVARLGDPALRVLVVGRDDSRLFRGQIATLRLGSQVLFLPPRADIETYYAAADCYVGPSLDDAFALPPAEAMACGLPVIVSAAAGVSEIVTDGEDAFVLKDPRDADELARLIRRVCEDASLRRHLGERAAQTARRYTWERNAAEMTKILDSTLRQRSRR
jgi:glycosyltransferase involved in cell wall biosynthesis